MRHGLTLGDDTLAGATVDRGGEKFFRMTLLLGRLRTASDKTGKCDASQATDGEASRACWLEFE
jgi:hypothetical protein